MIKEKILLLNDSSCICQKCLSCYQFNHILEKCPKLHYIPSSETIIKKLNFPFFHQRLPFIRNRKKFPHSLKTKFSNQLAQKKLENRLKMSSKMEQSLALSNNSSGDDEEKTGKEALEENEKNISKMDSSVHEEIIKQETKPFSDEKIYLAQGSTTMNNNTENDQPFASFQKLKEGMEKDIPSEYLMKNKTLKETFKEEKGKKINSQGNLNEIREADDFEKVCLFQKYFPNQNIDKIITKLPKLLTKEKEIIKKYLKRKYKKLKYYSFLVNPIVERFLEESKAKKIKKSFSIVHRKKNNEGSDALFSTFKSMQMDELSRASPLNPLKKKSYFETNILPKNQKISFVELINTLVEKNRQIKLEIKLNRKLKAKKSFIF